MAGCAGSIERHRAPRKRQRHLLAGLVTIALAAGLLVADLATVDAHRGVARADVGSGYPYANAVCEFGNAGGPSCVNPNNSQDLYDWGYFNGSTFQPYDGWGYEYRNCTSYVAWRLANAGVSASLFSQLGNADTWLYNVEHRQADINAGVTVDNNPTPGSVAVWNSPGVGHVAWVESTNPVVVSDYNYATTGAYNPGHGLASTPSGYIHFPGVSSSGGLADGTFVSYQGNVYRMAGGAPLYVSTWSAFGGPQPTQALSDQQWAALRPFPADGTVIRTAQNGEIYVVVGGAPTYVSTCAVTCAVQVNIDQWDIANAGTTPSHLRAYPVDGTVIRTAQNGEIYIVVGGAPTYVSTCTVTCAAQANIDQWDVDNAGFAPTHLRQYPADGTVIRTAQDGNVYIVAGGAPLYVSTCAVTCAIQANIDQWDVANAGTVPAHLRPYPADGTFVRTSTGAVYEIAGGAPFYLDSWATVGGQQPYTNIDQWDVDNRANPAAHLLPSPASGTVVSGLPSGDQWAFGSQACRSATAAASAPVPVPDSGVAAYTLCPQVVTPTLPDSIRGVAYSASLSASGGSGSYVWSLTGGTLPAGLMLSASGTISGTPTALGSSTFTVQVADSSTPALTAAAALTLTVVPIAVTTTSLPADPVDVAYKQTLTAAGGTGRYTWKVTGGALPPGLTLSAGTSLSPGGVLSGTPTVAGSYTFTVQVTDAASPPDVASRSLTLVIAPMTVATSSLPNAPVGRSYSAKLVTSGGKSTFTWSLSSGALPAGLKLSTAGALTGAPTAVGTSTFTVSVHDASKPANTASRTLTITVTPMQITTASLPAGVVKKAYSAKLAVSGGKGTLVFSLASGSLPSGVKLSSAGAFSGTPTAAGSWTFTVRVHDSSSPQDVATRAYTLTVS